MRNFWRVAIEIVICAGFSLGVAILLFVGMSNYLDTPEVYVGPAGWNKENISPEHVVGVLLHAEGGRELTGKDACEWFLENQEGRYHALPAPPRWLMEGEEPPPAH